MWFAHVVYCYIIQQCQVFVKSLFLNSAKKSIIRRRCGSQLCIAAPFSGRANPSGHTMTPPNNSHNSQTGVAQLDLRAAVVIKQFFMATLYFVVNHHCGRANPSGHTMTPPTIPIILTVPIIPITPRLASPLSACVPQWSSSSFFGRLNTWSAVSPQGKTALSRCRRSASWALKCCSKKYCLRLTFFLQLRALRGGIAVFFKNSDVNSATRLRVA